MGRHKYKEAAGDDGAEGDGDAPKHWWTPVPFDPSANWRFNHHAAFLVLGILAPTFDIALAAFMCFEHFDMEAYVWGPCVAFVILEAVYIGASVGAIESKKFVGSKLDLGWPLSLLWAFSLGASVSFFLGAFQASTTEDQTILYAGFALAVLSNICTIVLSIVAYMKHILFLEDPRDPEEAISLRHRHHRRRKHKQAGTDEEYDA